MAREIGVHVAAGIQAGRLNQFLLGRRRLLQLPIGQAQQQVRLIVAVLSLHGFLQVVRCKFPLVVVEIGFAHPEIGARRRRPLGNGGGQHALRFAVLLRGNERLDPGK